MASRHSRAYVDVFVLPIQMLCQSMAIMDRFRPAAARIGVLRCRRLLHTVKAKPMTES